MASMKPSKATAHPSPSPSRIVGPPPPHRVVASPSAQRSPKATARAEPSRSAPPPQDRTYIREKASSKPLSKASTARPPRPVRPSHETATNKPSKPVTPRPLPFDPNMFMAGKLAHEYLTKGTLFGQPYVPTEADLPPAPLSPSSADVRSRKEPNETDDKEKEKEKEKENGTRKGKGKAIEIEPKPNSKSSEPEQQPASNVRYANVSKKLMNRGMYIPGIVNPSKLADFLNRYREIE